jgi:hypothetical protein
MVLWYRFYDYWFRLFAHLWLSTARRRWAKAPMRGAENGDWWRYRLRKPVAPVMRKSCGLPQELTVDRLCFTR